MISNTQFNVLGVFRVAVEKAEEQLGPFDDHYPPPSFCSTAQRSFLNHRVNSAHARKKKHLQQEKGVLISIHRLSASEEPEWKPKP